MADTRLQLAHFHHHRPHKGARRHSVGEATPEPTQRPGRRRSDQAGLKHANPVAKAMGKVSPAALSDVLKPIIDTVPNGKIPLEAQLRYCFNS